MANITPTVDPYPVSPTPSVYSPAKPASWTADNWILVYIIMAIIGIILGYFAYAKASDRLHAYHDRQRAPPAIELTSRLRDMETGVVTPGGDDRDPGMMHPGRRIG